MISDAQRRRLYFPAWRRAFSATWTVAPSGRITPKTAEGSETPENEFRNAIEAVAGRYAAAEARGVTETDLRHAANALALQRARSWRAGSPQPLPPDMESSSSRKLDGLGLGLFLALCNLLEEPTWLGTAQAPGLMDWEDPGRIERGRILWRLDHQTSPGYAAALSRDLYGTRDYHQLPFADLVELERLLRERPKAWRPHRSNASTVKRFNISTLQRPHEQFA